MYADANFCGNSNNLDLPNHVWQGLELGLSIFMPDVPEFGNQNCKQNSPYQQWRTKLSVCWLHSGGHSIDGDYTRMKNKGYQVLSTQPQVHCHALEGNSMALELASTAKYCP